MKTCVIFPAAGLSSRFGEGEKKPYINLHGIPVWQRTVQLFYKRPDVYQLILVISSRDRKVFQLKYNDWLAFHNIDLAEGGAERHNSVANALKLLKTEVTHIGIHDAVRPCVTTSQINEVFTAACASGAAVLATRVVQTVKKSNSLGQICQTISRDNLWLAQTPQVFEKSILIKAYALHGNTTSTDDSQLVELLGFPVQLVPCGPENIKITTPEDLRMAHYIIRHQQIFGANEKTSQQESP